MTTAIPDKHRIQQLDQRKRWYWQERYKLLSAICGRSPPACERCHIVWEIAELHIHHVCGDGTRNGMGGYQALLQHRKD